MFTRLALEQSLRPKTDASHLARTCAQHRHDSRRGNKKKRTSLPTYIEHPIATFYSMHTRKHAVTGTLGTNHFDLCAIILVPDEDYSREIVRLQKKKVRCLIV